MGVIISNLCGCCISGLIYIECMEKYQALVSTICVVVGLASGGDFIS